MPNLSRRSFLGGIAACVVPPLSADMSDWRDIVSIASAWDQFHAIAIHRRGKQVLSARFRGPAIGRTVPIKSVSKTIVTALVGAALDRAEIPSVNSTLGELIPGLIPAAADPLVASISIENLMTMQAGLQRTSGVNYGSWVGSRDWVANALSRPMVARPGTRMLYSTGNSHVLGAMLSEISGKSLLALARERIGRPLGIEIPAWTSDPQGRYLGGNEMAMALPGMIRFGELYRNAGRAGDVQVLSEEWVRHSLVSVTRSMFSGLGYGYGWFLGNSRGTFYALARGYGGQVICIIPELEVTLAITSDPNRPARSAGYFGDLMRLIEGAVIPFAQSEKA